MGGILAAMDDPLAQLRAENEAQRLRANQERTRIAAERKREKQYERAWWDVITECDRLQFNSGFVPDPAVQFIALLGLDRIDLEVVVVVIAENVNQVDEGRVPGLRIIGSQCFGNAFRERLARLRPAGSWPASRTPACSRRAGTPGRTASETLSRSAPAWRRNRTARG